MPRRAVELREVITDARGVLAGLVIGRPPKGTPPCFKCNDKDPDGAPDPLITKVKKVKDYGEGISSAEFAAAAGKRICRRTQCFKWYTKHNQVRYRYRARYRACCLLLAACCLLLAACRCAFLLSGGIDIVEVFSGIGTAVA